MDTSGFLIYKCRRCGKIGKFFDAPDGMITLYSLMIDKPLPKEWGGFKPLKIEVCRCDDGNLGVSDLIGFEYDKKEGEIK